MKSAAMWACVFVVLASCEGLCPICPGLEFTLRAKGLDILLKLSVGLCVAGGIA